MTHSWIAERMRTFDSSGIRKVFELAKQLRDPIDFSIGQPDFDVPEEVKRAAIEAIEQGRNGYSLTQGVTELRERLQADVDARYGHGDRRVMVTSGTSGGLVLAALTLLDRGDEVIVFDPYFVMYPALVGVAGGRTVTVDTYPDFRIDINRLQAALTPRTKAIMVNSPGNPTGVVASADELRAMAELAAERNVALLSDEIYHAFCYDGPFTSPAEFNDRTIVLDGFSKTYGMTGWRLGYAHGPAAVIDEMTKLQQYTFVCAPQPVQWAGLAAMNTDVSDHIDHYRRKRDRIVAGLADDYEIAPTSGAFYVFPKAPWGTGTEFTTKAIENNVLVIPGSVFSARDTHFRISYAVDDATIDRGIAVLRRLARG